MAKTAKWTIEAQDKSSATLGKIDKNSSKLDKTLKALGRSGKVALGAVAVGATAADAAVSTLTAATAKLTSEGLKNVDATAKLSDRIGISTEALVGLQHAAELTGAGSKVLESSLGAMSKRLGEAAQGFGSGKKALDAMGLSAKDLIGLPVDKQLGIIADRVKGFSTQAEKAAAVSGLFSRAGLALVNTLELGSDGLRAAQEEAEALGLTFSRIDASKVEEATDALARARTIYTGLSNQLAVALAPAIQNVSERILEMVQELGGSAEVVDVLIERLDGIIQPILNWINAGQNLRTRWEIVLEGFSAAFFKLSAEFDTFVDKTVRGFVKLIKAADKYANAIKNATFTGRLLPDFETDTSGLVGFARGARRARDTNQALLDSSLDTVTDLEEELRNREPLDFSDLFPERITGPEFEPGASGPEQLRRERPPGADDGGLIPDEPEVFKTDFGDYIDGVGEVVDITQEANHQVDERIKKSDEEEFALKGVAKSYSDLAAQIATTTRLVEEADWGHDDLEIAKTRLVQLEAQAASSVPVMERAMESFGRVTGSVFQDFLRTGKFAFEDWAAAAVSAIARVIAQQVILNALQNSSFGSGAFGQFLGGVLQNLEGGGSTGSGPRSGGVDGRGGFPAILHPDETVIDHRRGRSSGGMSGGSHITYQTNNIQPGVSQEMIPQIIEAASQAALAQISDINFRGGQRAR